MKHVRMEGGQRLLLVLNDLLREPVDAIVNAANGQLAHGGGVAAAIARVAGEALVEEGAALVAEHGTIPTGEAVVTTAGRLGFLGVIHAVGPRHGDGDEEVKLRRTVASALLRAHEQEWRSISMPAISSGIFAVPLEVCARAYVAGTELHYDEVPDSWVEEVRICLLAGPLVALVESEMERLEGN